MLMHFFSKSKDVQWYEENLEFFTAFKNVRLTVMKNNVCVCTQALVNVSVLEWKVKKSKIIEQGVSRSFFRALPLWNI